MIKSFVRGHEVEVLNGWWYYLDTHDSTINNERPCGHCGKENTPEGHDGCLGTLPDIMNACCGHGEIDKAYVQFDVLNVLSGQDAIDWIKTHNPRRHTC